MIFKRLGDLLNQNPEVDPVTTIQVQVDERTELMLQSVVDKIVDGLNFKAAMIAVVEERPDADNRPQRVIAVRAFAVNTRLIPGGAQTLLEWGEHLTGQKLMGNYIALTAENEAINAAVRAIRRDEDYSVVYELHELFRPALEDKTLCDRLQRFAGLKSFITVPFRNDKGNLIGNLYAALGTAAVPEPTIHRLQAFTGMATVALDNARLYRSHLRVIGREQILKTTITRLLDVTLDTQRLLDDITASVVQTMGFKACMVAVVENIGEKQALRVVAYRFTPGLQGLLEWGEKLAGLRLDGQYLFLDAATARVNLAVHAVLNDQPYARTQRLSELFSPVLPELLSNQFQQQFGIQELISVPLRNREGKLRGNMYAGSGAGISEKEIEELNTFALAASIAIDNANQHQKIEHLYRESRRMGLMASTFGHAAHKINNMLGGVKLVLERDLHKMTPQNPAEEKRRVRYESAFHQVKGSLDIIQGLKRRMTGSDETAVDVHDALATATQSLVNGEYGYRLPRGIVVDVQTVQVSLKVLATEELSEIFRVVMKNGCEAMGRQGHLSVRTSLYIDPHTQRRFAEVRITDDGPGVPPDVLATLFQLKPGSTKVGGMGYGLWSAHLMIQWYDGSMACKTRTQHDIDSNPKLAGLQPGTSMIMRLPLLTEKQLSEMAT